MATTEEMEKLQRARPGRGRLLIVVAVLVIAVALIAVAVYAGWLFPSGSPKAKTALNGAGATFPCPLITAWSSEFVNVTRAPTTPGPQVTVNYNCVGSGAGITQITSKTVDFAGTDAPLKSSERSAAPGLLHIPETIGAVTASYSVVELSTGIKLRGYTFKTNMKVAQIRNHAGQGTTPTLATTAAAAAALTSPPSPGGDWADVSILDQPGATSYPIATLTYLLVYKELNVLTTMDQTKAQALVDFLWWAVHGGQDLSEAPTYPKLAAGLVALDEGAIRSLPVNRQTLHS